MDCFSSQSFPTSETRRRKWQAEWTRWTASNWLSSAKWKVQSLALISSQRQERIWLFFLVRPVSEIACLHVDGKLKSHESNEKKNFLHKIDGTRHKQLVNIAPWMTSSSGRILKASRHKPMTCSVSKIKTIPNSFHVKLLMLLKNQSLRDRRRVPHSGTAKANTIAHFQAMICSTGIKAASVFSGTDKTNKNINCRLSETCSLTHWWCRRKVFWSFRRRATSSWGTTALIRRPRKRL